ncbi:hypothetical protein OVA24_18140 [Luteolibacter sp. SL250]|uniref:hypothetical protein n=1 Tax=Luteolibacter sp. SL250 TaxID=2995170 RepID=UPI00226F7850|nr:hypothetical protein [Luteolibacter sp. SL250]WAC19150.1 hypothetical protein OVA24_18140 [Luteolibacter sp. SL250]
MKLLSIFAAAMLTLPAAGQSLLVTPTLQGTTENAVWSLLSGTNTVAVPGTNPVQYECSPDDFTDASVVFRVHSPGYGATSGLYSWGGAYETTTTKTASSFAIKQAVFQLDLLWDPANPYPGTNIPRLSYNGGTQNLAPLPVILGGSRIEENTVPGGEAGTDPFTYRGVMWQWDLSQIGVDITSVAITTPYANHTSVSGARVDVASQFRDLAAPASTPLQTWRDRYFQTADNSGDAADDADPDGDGIANLVEYALGTRPDSADADHGASRLPALSTAGPRPSISFRLPTTLPAELTYQVRSSGNLADWKVIASKTGSSPWIWSGDGPDGISSQAVTGGDLLTIQDEVTVSGNARRFMHLRISY